MTKPAAPNWTTADKMVQLLLRMLAPNHQARLKGAMIAAQNGAPPCECGDCEICLWQYIQDEQATLNVTATAAAAENVNFRATLDRLRQLGRDALKRHKIALTETRDGVTRPVPEPELEQALIGLDHYIGHQHETVERAKQAQADAAAALRGYNQTAKDALDERDQIERHTRALSAQYEACMGLAAEALHVEGGVAALAKGTKLTELIGRLASTRDTALAREIAMRLFIEGHAQYVTQEDTTRLRVEVPIVVGRTRERATVVLEGAQLAGVINEAVRKISEAWALPGSPATRLLRDSRVARSVAAEADEAIAWIPTLQVVPSEEFQGKTAIGALRHVITSLLSRAGAQPTPEVPEVDAKVTTTLQHLQSQARAQTT